MQHSSKTPTATNTKTYPVNRRYYSPKKPASVDCFLDATAFFCNSRLALPIVAMISAFKCSGLLSANQAILTVTDHTEQVNITLTEANH